MIRVRVDVDHVSNRDTPFTPLPPLRATENLQPAVYDRVSGCSAISRNVWASILV